MVVRVTQQLEQAEPLVPKALMLNPPTRVALSAINGGTATAWNECVQPAQRGDPSIRIGENQAGHNLKLDQADSVGVGAWAWAPTLPDLSARYSPPRLSSSRNFFQHSSGHTSNS